MSMEVKDKYICWIVHLVGQWFTLQCVKSHWAGPTGLTPHLDKERGAGKESGAQVGGEMTSRGPHAKLGAVGTEK